MDIAEKQMFTLIFYIDIPLKRVACSDLPCLLAAFYKMSLCNRHKVQ